MLAKHDLIRRRDLPITFRRSEKIVFVVLTAPTWFLLAVVGGGPALDYYYSVVLGYDEAYEREYGGYTLEYRYHRSKSMQLQGPLFALDWDMLEVPMSGKLKHWWRNNVGNVKRSSS